MAYNARPVSRLEPAPAVTIYGTTRSSRVVNLALARYSWYISYKSYGWAGTLHSVLLFYLADLRDDSDSPLSQDSSIRLTVGKRI